MSSSGRLNFDPSDPFPLLNGPAQDYEAEKQHAAEVDAWLGLAAESIEQALVLRISSTSSRTENIVTRPREFWIGKSVQTFSTPYTELRFLLEELRLAPDDTIVDLGAGYGRMAHVLARHFPRVRFHGYEIVPERQQEGERILIAQKVLNASLVCADVTQIDFSASPAEFFFLYDFGSREDVEIVIENLKKVAIVRPITVIARGGRSRDIIEKRHPWLSQVVTPLHRGHYSLYRSAE